jgi:transcription antitermination factor NusG
MNAAATWECGSPALPMAATSSYWYAIQTRSRHEKAAATQLSGRGITTFLPLVNELRRWSDRCKAVQLPLFPGYAFVRISRSAEERARVLRVDGVVSFVGAHGEGARIPDVQIEDIRRLVNTVQCTSYPFLKVGQRVRIRGGCLEGIEGILVARNGNRTLVISVEPIQRSIAVSIENFDIVPL